MEMEQFRELIKLAESVGSYTGPLLWAWMILDKLIVPITWLITLLFFYKISLRILSCIRLHSDLRDIRDILGTGINGMMSDGEYRRTMNEIMRLVIDSKQMKG